MCYLLRADLGATSVGRAGLISGVAALLLTGAASVVSVVGVVSTVVGVVSTADDVVSSLHQDHKPITQDTALHLPCRRLNVLLLSSSWNRYFRDCLTLLFRFLLVLTHLLSTPVLLFLSNLLGCRF